MTAQEMYSHINPVQASEMPSAMTVAQIDEALRVFVLQDTAHLRRDTENSSQSASGRDLENQPQISELLRRMAGASLNKLDETIVDLSRLRDFLHAEGERIKREISGYLQLNRIAIGSTKVVVDNIAQCRAAAAAIAPRPARARAESERSDTPASPSAAPPS